MITALIYCLCIEFLLFATCTLGNELSLASDLEISSPFTPVRNTSYGEIQIIDTISIELDLTTTMPPYNIATSSPYTNIFVLKSSSSSSSYLDHSASNSYCTKYPSLWLSPLDNTLYFSSLNFNASAPIYCLQPLQTTLAPNTVYSLHLEYDQSSIRISINDTIVFSANHWFSVTQHADYVTLWITDAWSTPASSIRVSNFYLTTSSAGYADSDGDGNGNISNTQTKATNFTKPANRNLYPNDVQSNPHENSQDTIIVIEVAVVTVFAFACLGVVVAVSCLLKMRSLSRNTSKHPRHSKDSTKHAGIDKKNSGGSAKHSVSVDIGVDWRHTQIPHAEQIDYAKTRIKSNSDTEEPFHETYVCNPLNPLHVEHPQHPLRFPKSPHFQLAHQHSNDSNKSSNGQRYHHSTNTTYDSMVNSSQFSSKNHDESTISELESLRYEEQARRNLRSKSEQNYHEPIPKYDSSTLNTTLSSSKIAVGDNDSYKRQGTMNALKDRGNTNETNSNLNNNNSNETEISAQDVLCTSPLPASPVEETPAVDGAITIEMKPNQHDAQFTPTCQSDAYDLNSEEGDDVKLRRAAIQSQRVTNSQSEQHAIKSEDDSGNTNPGLAEQDTDRDADADIDEDDDEEEEQPMDGLPAIQSAYCTLRRNPTKETHGTCASSSLEDMYQVDENKSSNPPDRDTNGASTSHTGTCKEQTTSSGITARTSSKLKETDDTTNTSLMLRGVSDGPSVPSLDTEQANRFSNITNKTQLTSIANRFGLPSVPQSTESMRTPGLKGYNPGSDAIRDYNHHHYGPSNHAHGAAAFAPNHHKFRSQSTSFNTDMDGLSSGDESTCVTQTPDPVPLPSLRAVSNSTVMKIANSVANHMPGAHINGATGVHALGLIANNSTVSAMSMVHTVQNQPQSQASIGNVFAAKLKETKILSKRPLNALKHDGYAYQVVSTLDHERKSSDSTDTANPSTFDSLLTSETAVPSFQYKDDKKTDSDFRNDTAQSIRAKTMQSSRFEDEGDGDQHRLVPSLENNTSNNSVLGRIQRIKLALTMGNHSKSSHGHSAHSSTISDGASTMCTNTASDTDDDMMMTFHHKRNSGTPFMHNETSLTSLDHTTPSNNIQSFTPVQNSNNGSSYNIISSGVYDRIPRFLTDKKSQDTSLMNKIKNTGIRASRKIRDSIIHFEDKKSNEKTSDHMQSSQDENEEEEKNGKNDDDDDDDEDEDGEGSDESYEWIKETLKSCDPVGWTTYYKNFRAHKVNETRLNKLGDTDWRELIPAIGPRNDFKEMWSLKKIEFDSL